MPVEHVFNNKIRQVILLLILLGLALVLLIELSEFIPAFLGAITLYIISRERYIYLTTKRKWKRGASALLFILLFLLCIGLPVWIAVDILSPRVQSLFNNQEAIMQSLKSISAQIHKWTGQELLSDANIVNIQKKLTAYIPTLLNSTLTILSNLALMLFIAYFMFTNHQVMEKKLEGFIPLQSRNVHILAGETKNMIRANALGIPLISLIQGVFAMIGYWIFGVKDFVLWGFITGLFAFFPLVGTMIIWVPLVVYVYSTGSSFNGTGLLLYSLIVTGNVDYLARITLLRKIGDVHPLITVLGVIVGLQLFGFWGFIFGPLLISYFMLMIRIYNNEFGGFGAQTHHPTGDKD
ncbi:AI-2E family transporter [Sediminibacterium soli]|uniref:AI-2E family transporter n=1 Tax=Sediminibacterium soli TaxID=2698829 RepID=UPI0013797AB9|nr:AI-2E family transporter [Sediminibacterium soli]NCI45208.1 AI-2E family transporter [Sediminibacterium soli]